MTVGSWLFLTLRAFRALPGRGLVLCVLLAACGFQSDNAGLARLRTQIREQLGTEAAVTVHTSQGATTVTVRLEHLPSADSKQVQARVEALAKAEFPKTNYVVVTSRL